MRKLDILTALIVLSSIFIFIKPGIFQKTNEAGLISAKVFEGDTFSNRDGKTGLVEIGFLNPESFAVNCTMKVKIYQPFFGMKYTKNETIEFLPNITYHNISIELPNGNNRVEVDADC